MAVRQVKVFPDAESLNAGTAEWLLAASAEAIARRGRCTLAFSGGSTPRGLYRMLAGESWRGRFDWSRIELFQVDERVVPPEHPDSNFGMIRRELLEPAGIPEQQVHRMPTELGAQAGAAEYELELQRSLSAPPSTSSALAEEPRQSAVPELDVVLLGIGEDGHTASLFPGTEALRERQRLALGYRVEKLNADRITLTFPVLNQARRVLFLVAGGSKASIVRDVLEGDRAEGRFPAAMVNPTSGLLYWHLDHAAASGIHTAVSE
jgi:6-phosphogluconolactonase